MLGLLISDKMVESGRNFYWLLWLGWKICRRTFSMKKTELARNSFKKKNKKCYPSQFSTENEVCLAFGWGTEFVAVWPFETEGRSAGALDLKTSIFLFVCQVQNFDLPVFDIFISLGKGMNIFTALERNEYLLPKQILLVCYGWNKM